MGCGEFAGPMAGDGLDSDCAKTRQGRKNTRRNRLIILGYGMLPLESDFLWDVVAFVE
jgi:hypothetical protein